MYNTLNVTLRNQVNAACIVIYLTRLNSLYCYDLHKLIFINFGFLLFSMTTGKPIEGNASVLLTVKEPQNMYGGVNNINSGFVFEPRSFTIQKSLGYVSTLEQ